MPTGNAPGARGGRGTMGGELRGKFTAPPKGYKPPRDRQVVHHTVVCPVHGTPVGEHCIGSTGRVQHCPPRRRLALRKLREDGLL